MFRSLGFLAIAFALAYLPPSHSYGQMAGNRAVMGVGGMEATQAANLPLLEPKIAEGYITIEGLAELRVQPTEIRIVMAATAEGETAQKCRQAIDATIANLKAAWLKMEIPSENIVVDFIAVLPRYAWSVEKHDTVDVGVEKKIGYRMQTNIHLAVRNESQTQAALNRAFEQGVTDIIAFDYWSKDLDGLKAKARQQALDAARGKSDVLLGALFAERPPIINVQEKTTVRYPESLYQSISGNEEDTVREGWRNNIPFIRAYRPRQTYYRGLYSDGDIQPRELPMQPEISVISIVRLYFKSPASGHVKKEEKASKESK
ncbi:MAG: SIMPL domain-containing protein [Thermoguttaceae bacterium]|jgi:uncharacterized protein YggE